MQSSVQSLLRSRAAYYIGALALTYVFWWSGLTKIWEFSAAQDEVLHFGLEPAAFFAAATIVVQLGASALVVFGRRWAWVSAALGAASSATPWR